MTSPTTPPPGQPDPAALLALGLATQAADAGPSSAPPLTPGELAAEFPRLEILELLGRGGMGAVYKARQRDLDRLVALKILRPGLDADPGFAERFTREARALAQLNHPGIVTLYEFGKTSAGRYFILMEFVDGVNLRQLLSAGRLSPREALAIVPPLCDALQYAHDRGLIHRDIKPENILIDRLGRVKIADFGIARLASEGTDRPPGRPSGNDSPNLTSAGEVMGTPHYMAPEQRDRPAEVDHRADLYALGVVFYQMLTGELPAAGKLQPPSHRVQLDVRLDEIVLRALERSPELRYHAASEFKTAVETVASSPPPVPPRKTPRRPFIAAGVYAALVLFGLVWMLASNPKDEFRGLIAIATTFPWSVILTLVLAGVFKIQLGTMATAVPIVLASGALNTFLIFRLFGGGRSLAPRDAGAIPVKARVETVAQPTPIRHNLSPWHGFLLLVAAFAALLALTAHGLPVRMASHFDETGRANGWMDRTPYLLLIGVLPGFIAALLAASAWSLKKLPVRLINLPHRDHWLAPERRAATAASFGRWMAGPACLIVVFFAELHLTTLLANRLIPPRLESGLLLGPTIGFLSALMVWMVGLVLRFSDPAASSAKLHRQGVAITLAAALALVLPSIPLVSRVVSDKRSKLENSGPATSGIVTPRFQFGRVREITLPRSRPVAYDFDRERFVDYKPTPQSPHGIETSVQWHTGNGTDVFADPGSRLPGVLFLGTDLTEVNPKLWDATADEAAHQSGTPDRGIMTFVAAPAAGQPGPARVYRTPQGGAVLVQLLGAADNGDVRLRYKAILSIDASVPATSKITPRQEPQPAKPSVQFLMQAGPVTFNEFTAQIRTVITQHFPNAVIEASEKQFEASFATQEFQIHGRLKSGVITPSARTQTGPADTGFMLTVTRITEPYHGQTLLPATGRSAYWNDFQTTGFDPDRREGVHVSLRFGANLPRSFHEQIMRSLGWIHQPAKPLVDNHGQPLPVVVEPFLTEKDIATIERVSRESQRILRLSLTPSGAFRLNQLTQVALGRRIAILIDGRVLTAPRVEAELNTDEIDLPDSLPEPETQRLLDAFPGPAPSAYTQVVKHSYDWLRNVDQGDYAQSWTTASASLRNAITRENWVAALQKARGPSPAVMVTRQLKTTQVSSVLPGAGEGHYFILQFYADLDNSESVAETLTLTREISGDWRVVSYLVRPSSGTEQEAVAKAQAWLEQIDAGQFGLSWDLASDAFRLAITRDQWIASLNAIRPSLGKVKIRLINTSQTTTNLPGAPDGRYIVMTFNTVFEHKQSAAETVTFEELKDGTLRASGYFIKPDAATFDPVVEHTWTPSGSRFTGLLDLDTGHEFALAQLYVNQGPSMELVDVGTRQVVGKINLEDNKLGWLAEHKIDLLGTREKQTGILVGIGLTVVPVGPADWSALSAEDISNAAGLAIPSAPAHAETTLEGADTWLFRTREGS
ncbi:MAG TPA: DUF4019 domain-containing protein, partial [Rariglobus sp.]